MNSRARHPRIASNRNPFTVALAVALVALTTTASVLLACSTPADTTTSQQSATEQPTATPSPVPTDTPTSTPTATSTATATATPVPPIFVARELSAESVSAKDGEVTLVLMLEIENIGGPVVEETLPVSVTYRTDSTEELLTLSIPATDEMTHDFSVSVPPGDVRFDVEIYGESFPFDTVAEVADLQIVRTFWKSVSDGRIAVDVNVRDMGNLDAEGILVIGSTVSADTSETEGAGQIELIPEGESRTIEVLLDVPAGQHMIRLHVSTTSPEANEEGNSGVLKAEVSYVEVGYDFTFTPGGYWSDGSANVEVAVTAINSGIGAFLDVAEVSYSCAGAGNAGEVFEGKFELAMPDGFSAVTDEVTLRSSPGPMECTFISPEQGTQTFIREIPAKIVGVSREVWECYSDDTINRRGDIGCAGRKDERVVKWDLDRPLRVWATGDPDYIDVLWATLDRLSPLLGMTFTNTHSQDYADLKAWVGIPQSRGPEDLRSWGCLDSAGCSQLVWGHDDRITEASISVWTVGVDIFGFWTGERGWLLKTGLDDRRIEHVTLHELLHVLVPMNHRDDALSVMNNINAPDWLDLDPTEEALVRLHQE